MTSELFYAQVLTEHSHHPRYQRELGECTCQRRGVNHSCGDELTMQLRIEAGVIKDGGFTGQGCVLSRASADIALGQIIDQSVTMAQQQVRLFLDLVAGQVPTAAWADLGEAQVLREAALLPARVKCVTLAWHTLAELLETADEKRK